MSGLVLLSELGFLWPVAFVHRFRGLAPHRGAGLPPVAWVRPPRLAGPHRHSIMMCIRGFDHFMTCDALHCREAPGDQYIRLRRSFSLPSFPLVGNLPAKVKSVTCPVCGCSKSGWCAFATVELDYFIR